jgi:hypothetical protein
VEALRLNEEDLVIAMVSGQIAHPVAQANPYRVGYDGAVRVLPGTGGIAVNQRIGDRCVGLSGDHVEPGVALHNNGREVVGPRNGPNNALLTYGCVGNRATVISGPCTGQRGLVTGKHGGVNHLLVDFPTRVLERLRIGDRIQIRSCGLGLRLLDFPAVTVMNASPELLRRWQVQGQDGKLRVRVTHRIPSTLMGSGLGKNSALRGDYDIQIGDPEFRRRFRLGRLRYGDFVAIVGSATGHGPSARHTHTTVGVVVHGDSTVSGHGPGVSPLLSAPHSALQLIHDADANLAAVFDIRRPAVPRDYTPLPGKDRRRSANGRALPERTAPSRSNRQFISSTRGND